MMPSAEPRTPGQLLEDLLAKRGWSQRVLAVVVGIGETSINKLITGKKPFTADVALILGEVLDVAPDTFLDLQKKLDLEYARLISRPDPGRANRACLFGDLPIGEMVKRGWIEAESARDVPAVEAGLQKFFGVTSIEDIEILPHAAKRTDVVGPATPAQIAWLRRVKQIAQEMLVAPYSPTTMSEAIGRLKQLLPAAEEARHVPRILAEAGIRFVVVESLPTAKIDGACLWMNETSPVIGLSIRHDRIDNFWFVLRHEMEHVARGHGKTAVILDTELEGERAGVGGTVTEEERVANQAAAEFCVPQEALKRFIARKDPFFAERDILGFARTEGVHPGLVAGQLQHKTGRYDRFRQHQVKIRSIVLPGAIVDGWGDIAPVGP